MADIFISYSRKDSEPALSLAEKLRASGMDVWIDQHGIGGAEQWATEIATAIRDCEQFVVLLSRSSVASHNVLKEVTLASEKRKRILPIELEQVELPPALEYPLAGLQRVPIADEVSIIAVLNKIAKPIRAEKAPAKIELKRLKSRKALYAALALLAIAGAALFLRTNHAPSGTASGHSIAVMPFENNTGDTTQSYFVAGFGAELTNALTKIKSLRVSSPESVHQYSAASIAPIATGKELGVEYIAGGSIERGGGKLKIIAHVIDVRTGETVWSDSYSGGEKDIFSIEEEVPTQIASALRISLSSGETDRIQRRPTESVEAYDDYLKAADYAGKGFSEFSDPSFALFKAAIALDPKFCRAYTGLSSSYYEVALNNRDSNARRDALDTGLQMAVKAILLDPNEPRAHLALAMIYTRKHLHADAIAEAKKAIELSPNDGGAYYVLGMADTVPAEQAREYERSIALDSSNDWAYVTVWGLYKSLNSDSNAVRIARAGVPFLERSCLRDPNAQNELYWLAKFLRESGRLPEARQRFLQLTHVTSADAYSVAEIASELVQLGEKEGALAYLRQWLAAPTKESDRKIVRANISYYPDLAGLPEVKRLVRHD